MIPHLTVIDIVPITGVPPHELLVHRSHITNHLVGYRLQTSSDPIKCQNEYLKVRGREGGGEERRENYMITRCIYMCAYMSMEMLQCICDTCVCMCVCMCMCVCVHVCVCVCVCVFILTSLEMEKSGSPFL